MATPLSPRLVIVNSSLSSDSNTRMLSRHAHAHALQRGISADLIDLKDHRVLPYGEEGSEGLEQIEAQLEQAGAIILAFPLYNYNINSSLKALIEHCGACFEDKVVGLMTAAGGRSSYMSVFSVGQSLMLDFRSWIVPRYVYAVSDDFGAESIASPEVRRRVEQLVETIHRTAWQLQLEPPGG
ncbi:MAG: NAD(P)H-dependent oxidoreductase [Candidatus Latescibacteria bacterium]|nr:NAD(P)H-dependent oxidoreductase [Candidatus Latescibacterota bacterium]